MTKFRPKERRVEGGTGGAGHKHRFDPDSGWCHWCNLRDDGRLVGTTGDIYRPGTSEEDTQ